MMDGNNKPQPVIRGVKHEGRAVVLELGGTIVHLNGALSSIPEPATIAIPSLGSLTLLVKRRG